MSKTRVGGEGPVQVPNEEEKPKQVHDPEAFRQKMVEKTSEADERKKKKKHKSEADEDEEVPVQKEITPPTNDTFKELMGGVEKKEGLFDPGKAQGTTTGSVEEKGPVEGFDKMRSRQGTEASEDVVINVDQEKPLEKDAAFVSEDEPMVGAEEGPLGASAPKAPPPPAEAPPPPPAEEETPPPQEEPPAPAQEAEPQNMQTQQPTETAPSYQESDQEFDVSETQPSSSDQGDDQSDVQTSHKEKQPTEEGGKPAEGKKGEEEKGVHPHAKGGPAVEEEVKPPQHEEKLPEEEPHPHAVKEKVEPHVEEHPHTKAPVKEELPPHLKEPQPHTDKPHETPHEPSKGEHKTPVHEHEPVHQKATTGDEKTPQEPHQKGDEHTPPPARGGDEGARWTQSARRPFTPNKPHREKDDYAVFGISVEKKGGTERKGTEQGGDQNKEGDQQQQQQTIEGQTAAQPNVEGVTPIAQTQGATPHQSMHPQVFALFETMVKQISVEKLKDVTKTTVHVSMPGSVFDHAQISLERFATAQNTFHIQIQANPEALELLDKNMDQLENSLQALKGDYQYNLQKPVLLTEQHAVSRKGEDEGGGGGNQQQRDEDEQQQKKRKKK